MYKQNDAKNKLSFCVHSVMFEFFSSLVFFSPFSVGFWTFFPYIFDLLMECVKKPRVMFKIITTLHNIRLFTYAFWSKEEEDAIKRFHNLPKCSFELTIAFFIECFIRAVPFRSLCWLFSPSDSSSIAWTSTPVKTTRMMTRVNFVIVTQDFY